MVPRWLGSPSVLGYVLLGTELLWVAERQLGSYVMAENTSLSSSHSLLPTPNGTLLHVCHSHVGAHD